MTGHRGFAVITVLVLLVVVGSVSAVLIERSFTLDRGARADLEARRAFHAAEGGLAHARVRLAGDPDFAGAQLRVGPCTVTTTVVRDGKGWTVRSTATPGGARLEAGLAPAHALPRVATWRRLD